MQHSVVVIPGLGDRRFGIWLLVQHWRLRGLTPIVHTIGWNDDAFVPKLERLMQLVDECAARGTVSVVGISAGASAALNVFAARKDKIHRVVSVCGVVRILDPKDRLDAESKAFLESVDLFKDAVDTLTQNDRQKILTIRPHFGDERIKPENTILEGANNIEIQSRGHALSIGLGLTLLSQPLISFLKH